MEGKYEKAYSMYQKTLIMDPKNYDAIACFIGTALNLGYLDDAWNKSDLLIKMNEKRAQV